MNFILGVAFSIREGVCTIPQCALVQGILKTLSLLGKFANRVQRVITERSRWVYAAVNYIVLKIVTVAAKRNGKGNIQYKVAVFSCTKLKNVLIYLYQY